MATELVDVPLAELLDCAEQTARDEPTDQDERRFLPHLRSLLERNPGDEDLRLAADRCR